MSKTITTVAAISAVAMALTVSAPALAQDGPGELKIGNFLDVTSWDPALADIGFDGPYLSAVYDPLIALEPDGSLTPVLATSWEYSDDRTSITMDLRQGVTFHDGTAFDAEAAVANLEHLKAGARSNEAYVNVWEFKVVDEDTIQIDLTQRDDTILYLMGLGRSYMASPDKLDTLTEAPAGSGPYLLDTDRSVPGSEYHFNKVADHWDSETYPFEDIAIYPILDATARHNAMLSGQINVNFADAENIAQAEQMGWNIAARVSGWVGLQFVDHTGQFVEALADVRVRQALNYAFNGGAILNAIGAGAGVVTNQVFPAGTPGYDESLNDMYAYNLDKARELLAEAGYADGFAVTMPMSPIFAQWQPAVVQVFNELGIEVTWDDMQMMDYQINAPKYPLFISFIAMDNDPAATLARQLTSEQWYNLNPEYSEFPELADLVAAAKEATGEDQVLAITEVNRQLTEMAWWSVWYQAENTYFSTPEIEVQPVTGMMFPLLRHIQPK